MVRLVIGVLFSLFVAYFAIQNTTPATVTLAGYTIEGTPMYIIVLGTLLTGLLIGVLFHFLYRFSSSFSMRGKDKELKEAQQEITQLTKRLHELELENANLTEGEEDDKSL